MGKYASEIIKLAQSWIGKKESDGSHKSIIDIYNSHEPLARGYKVKYTDNWCATTISALAIKLGYTDIIPTECGCEKQIELFKKIGCFKEDEAVTPKVGWIIFYDWDDNGKGDNKGWSDHVGIVEKVDGKTITVIEGNYGDAVKRRTIEVNAKYIRGYGVPEYDAEPVKSTKKSIDDIAKEVIDGKWGTGTERKKALIKAGYDYTKVQARVNELLKGATTSKCYPKYTGTSYGIDTVFKAIGVPEKFTGNYKNRKAIAKANGIANYTGSQMDNLKLVNYAKQGKLKRP